MEDPARRPSSQLEEKPNRQQSVSILSLDGGGMRGVFLLQVLLKLETVTGRKVSLVLPQSSGVCEQLSNLLLFDQNLQIRDMFDLICGTSTGGIVALGLVVARMEVQELLDLYLTLGEKIFSAGVVEQAARAAFLGARYGIEDLKATLQQVLGEDVTLRSCADRPQKVDVPPPVEAALADFTLASTSSVLVIVTSYHQVFVVASTDTNHPREFLFRNYDLPDLQGTWDCTAWEAAMASGAAHTFFDSFKVAGVSGSFRDGGVVANNPTKLALQQAALLFPGQPIACVVSVGTGRQPLKAGDTKSVKAAVMHIAHAATDSHKIHGEVKQLCQEKELPYFRFNTTVDVELNAVDDRSISTLIAAADTHLGSKQVKLAKLKNILTPSLPPLSLRTALEIRNALLGEIAKCEAAIEVLVKAHHTLPTTTLDAHCVEEHSKQFQGLFDSIDVGLAETLSDLISTRALLTNLEVTMAVLGTLNAGKSTVINALVGKEIMPHRDTAMTSVPVIVTLSPKHSTPVLHLPKPEIYNECLDFLAAHAVLLEEHGTELEMVGEPWVRLVEKAADSSFPEFQFEYEGEKLVREKLLELNDLVRATYNVELLKHRLEASSALIPAGSATSQHGGPSSSCASTDDRSSTSLSALSSPSAAVAVATSASSTLASLTAPLHRCWEKRSSPKKPKFEHNPLDKLTFPDEYPRVLTRFGEVNQLAKGTKLSLIDCPGYNEAGYPADAIMVEIMRRTNAVLPVLNYTILSASNDSAFDERMRQLFRRLGTDHTYVLVNKFDQRDERSIAEDETRRRVAHLLREQELGEVKTDRIAPVSAKLAFQANHILSLLAAGSKIDPQTDWVAKAFVRQAFGARGQRRPISDEMMREEAEALYEESNFGPLLRRVVEDMLRSGKITALTQALWDVRNATQHLLNRCLMRQGTFLSSAEALRDTAATLEQQKATFVEDQPHFYRLRDRAINEFENMVTGLEKRSQEKLREEWSAKLSDEELRGIAVKKGLPVRKRSWLWWCNSGINFPTPEQHNPFVEEMARRFDQLFDSMSEVRSELKAEAKALFENLYNTLRSTVRTNQQLASSLKVSLSLPPMAPVLLVELPSLKDTKRSLRDRIFTNITWTSTQSIREDFLAKAQNTLKQVIEDDKVALRNQIRQQSDAALDSFQSTLHQITTQFEYCRMLQNQFPGSDQELTQPFADCITQLTAVNRSLDHIQAELALYAKASTGTRHWESCTNVEGA